ncbi:hypothetical protein F4824DRAFT_506036 [Ustulina deusta]|nr:hypothetical protein F4823DRAFT_563626 [Ustulina deusta]KAI3329589.1 hypothetical protein F4824DRAFT_506036 [Ustulina deusta]
MPRTPQCIVGTQSLNPLEPRHLAQRLIMAATQRPDLVAFTTKILIEPSHTSESDPTPHIIVLLATDDQWSQNKHHVVHIHHDNDGNYTGHRLYPETQS